MARNQRIKQKLEYFEMKMRKLRDEQQRNEAKARELLHHEKKSRKYKIE